MELTKEQTYQLFANRFRKSSCRIRYKFTTKTAWKCISCLKPLYISYACVERQNIFCPECFKTWRNIRTVSQEHYITRLKETQIFTVLNMTLKNVQNSQESIQQEYKQD